METKGSEPNAMTASDRHAHVEIQNVYKAFGHLLVIKNLSIRLEYGEVALLTGPNAAGKTTLLDLTSGDQRPEAGTVLVNGNIANRLDLFHGGRMGIARCYQHSGIFPDETVFENLALGMPGLEGFRFRRWLLWRGLCRRQLGTLREEASKFLTAFDLADRLDLPARDLSYGQQRIAELARAALSQSQLVLLDEPFAGLGGSYREQAFCILEQMKHAGRTLLVVAHGLDVRAQSLFDTHWELHDGHLTTVQPQQ